MAMRDSWRATWHFAFRSMAPINPRSGRFFGHTESLGNVEVKRRSTGTTATVQTKRKATPGSSTIMRNLNGPHEAEASRAWMHARLVATAHWLDKATGSCYLMATQATRRKKLELISLRLSMSTLQEMSSKYADIVDGVSYSRKFSNSDSLRRLNMHL
jgi:hypothetical protein